VNDKRGALALHLNRADVALSLEDFLFVSAELARPVEFALLGFKRPRLTGKLFVVRLLSLLGGSKCSYDRSGGECSGSHGRTSQRQDSGGKESLPPRIEPGKEG